VIHTGIWGLEVRVTLFFFRKYRCLRKQFPKRNALPLPHPHPLLDPCSAMPCIPLFPVAAVKLTACGSFGFQQCVWDNFLVRRER